ncbi:hypothetical protein [Agarilytica rhodophyticola]|uniref:hypothetical protein n=1 Tax=Agarilytica rhodophyticola TaxID=1737490 RepID=UPI00131A3815|nr:hypothetical protein [Agarilytica rhodophyticola]
MKKLSDSRALLEKYAVIPELLPTTLSRTDSLYISPRYICDYTTINNPTENVCEYIDFSERRFMMCFHQIYQP